MPLPYPVIVVPGITATYLKDDYQLPHEYVWTAMTKKFERLALHPNDLRYEAVEPARLRSDQLYEIAYKELLEELRYNLSSREDEPVPVYPFGYDWRMRLEDIQAELDSFIGEVIDRTKLLKHYYKAGYQDDPKVNLVGHSMGGLIITGYLKSKGTKPPVHKVATLATPYQGSFEAVIKVTTGTANLGTSPPSSRERESACVTPALYYLVPSFSGGLEVPDGVPKTLFDPGAWQPSIVQSIQSWIRLKGLPLGNPAELAEEIFANMLKFGKTHRTSINTFNLADAGMSPDRWLAVVGVDSTTRVRLKIVKNGRLPEFAFSSSDRDNN